MIDQWFYQADKVKAYLIDYHRPYNHVNINDTQNKIFVIHDGCQSFEECPTSAEDKIFEQM